MEKIDEHQMSKKCTFANRYLSLFDFSHSRKNGFSARRKKLTTRMGKQSEELPGTTVVDHFGCIVWFRLHRYQPNLEIK